MENFANNTNVNFIENVNEDIFMAPAPGGHGGPAPQKPSGSKKITDAFTFDLQLFAYSDGATSQTVSSWEDLVKALTDSTTTDITIETDITSTGTAQINITSTKKVNMGNHTLNLNSYGEVGTCPIFSVTATGTATFSGTTANEASTANTITSIGRHVRERHYRNVNQEMD